MTLTAARTALAATPTPTATAATTAAAALAAATAAERALRERVKNLTFVVELDRHEVPSLKSEGVQIRSRQIVKDPILPLGGRHTGPPSVFRRVGLGSRAEGALTETAR